MSIKHDCQHKYIIKTPSRSLPVKNITDRYVCFFHQHYTLEGRALILLYTAKKSSGGNHIPVRVGHFILLSHKTRTGMQNECADARRHMTGLLTGAASLEGAGHIGPGNIKNMTTNYNLNAIDISC